MTVKMKTDRYFGTYEERTGVNSCFFEENVKKITEAEAVGEDIDNPLFIVQNAYPRIHRMIVENWGTEFLHLRFSKLVALDTESREGFNQAVGMALLALHTEHMDTFHFEPIWTVSNMKRDNW